MTLPSEAELIEAAREALKPFADCAEWAGDDDRQVEIPVTLGDCRRAREVYRALTRAEGGKDAELVRELRVVKRNSKDAIAREVCSRAADRLEALSAGEK